MNAAAFLDKDGTLIEDVPYNVDPALIRLAPGAAAGLARLHAAGYALIVISNQSGVALGRFAEGALRDVEVRLRELLAEAGVPLAGFYYCPHHPAGVVSGYGLICTCRKPAPGLLLHAAEEHGIDLARSWFVGDILDDVEAGRRAGCRTVLIDNGNETEWVRSPLRWPDVVAADLDEAARRIVAADAGALTSHPDRGDGPSRVRCADHVTGGPHSGPYADHPRDASASGAIGGLPASALEAGHWRASRQWHPMPKHPVSAATVEKRPPGAGGTP